MFVSSTSWQNMFWLCITLWWEEEKPDTTTVFMRIFTTMYAKCLSEQHTIHFIFSLFPSRDDRPAGKLFVSKLEQHALSLKFKLLVWEFPRHDKHIHTYLPISTWLTDPFTILETSKSVDWRFWATLSLPIVGFVSSKIVKGSVGW